MYAYVIATYLDAIETVFILAKHWLHAFMGYLDAIETALAKHYVQGIIPYA